MSAGVRTPFGTGLICDIVFLVASPFNRNRTIRFNAFQSIFLHLALVVFWIVVQMIVAMFATSRILDKSIATASMGMMFPMLAIPFLSLAFVAWAMATRRLSDGPRRVAMVATILVACGAWALVRTGGFTSNFQNDLHWRWAKTPEERWQSATAMRDALAAVMVG